MVDDKKIESAKEEIYDDKFLGCGEMVEAFEDEDKMEMFDKEDIKEAIGLGAKWMQEEFLKDLWHPASEEPDVRHKTIICLYEDGDIRQDYDVYDEAITHDTFLGIGKFNWNDYAENEEIKKWCYATDLLPKEEGENERT